MIEYATASLLAASTALLISMVPGGSVETRSFAHLPRPVYWGFNVFLVLLGLASMAAVSLLLLRQPAGLQLAVICTSLLLLVFLLDLMKIYPKSPDEMEPALLILEAITLATSAAALVLALAAAWA
jgi:hypothetical protein